MSREKQIKGMARDIEQSGMLDNYSRCEVVAEELYDKGYRKQSEWISVEDRLPEKNVRVLVYIKSSRSYTRFDTDRLDDRGFVRWFNDVTHWMPLPEAPKKGGAE